MPDEKTFMDQDGVLVTTSRAVLNGTTYAMSGVTAVKVAYTPASALPTVGGIIIGFVGAVPVSGAIGAGDIFSKPTLVGVGMVLAGGFLVWTGARSKGTYTVVLSTASGSTTGLRTVDKALATSVSEAIAEAIVARG